MQIKKASAECEDAWKGAGTKVGLQVWRIVKFKVCFLHNKTMHVLVHLQTYQRGAIQNTVMHHPLHMYDHLRIY